MSERHSREWFPFSAQEGLQLFWSASEPHFSEALARLRDRLSVGPQPITIYASREQDEARDRALLEQVRRGVAGDFSDLEALVADAGALWANANLDLRRWNEAVEAFRSTLTARLVETYLNNPRSLTLALIALSRFVDCATATVTSAYLAQRERALSEQRRHTEEALMRYNRLSEAGIIGIFVCDIFGTPKEANDAFLNMIGYTREELLSGMSWIAMTPPEWAPLDEEAVRQLVASGRSQPWEKEYFRKDGTRVPILVGVAMLNATDCIAFILDISERKRMEELRLQSEALVAQNERIREASRMKSEFVANMSHELRTPLTAILGFAELLRDNRIGPESAMHGEFLGHILKSGGHLLQLITDVLDLAKVEAGKMEFFPVPLSLPLVVDEVRAILRTLAEDKQIELSSEIDPQLGEVVIDPVRFKQVLYNFVSNALKFTAGGGCVRVRCLPDVDGLFRVEVSDTGEGIAEDDVPKLFAEFQQLDSSSRKRHGGTGLGLALTRRIVEAQGGKVGVASRLGEGSTFYAYLPVRPT
jgi:PAS domain S-box-containing protein